MAVENGGTHVLAISGVHLGPAGSERSEGGALTVAFKPNIGRTITVGGPATLDDAPYRIVSASSSAVTAGFVRIVLEAFP